MSETRKPDAQQSGTQAGGEAGRVRCLYCGANNFPGSAACWQCGRPLSPTSLSSSTPVRADTGQAAPPPASPAWAGAPAARPSTLASSPDSALAPKAAAALGLLFPYVGLPVGIVFLMLDDPRKARLGWITIGWSLTGTVLNGLALAATLGPLWALLKGLTPHGGGLTPSLPTMPGGDGAGLILPFWV